jgi:hypothetical protein
VKLISNEIDSWLERTLNWSAVRPIGGAKSWSPVYLVAVARKEN